MSNNSSSSSGIGLPGLLTIVFVISKLFGKITWSWWWVFSPLWISTGIALAILSVILVLWIFTKCL
jgi:hypothetical protein